MRVTLCEIIPTRRVESSLSARIRTVYGRSGKYSPVSSAPRSLLEDVLFALDDPGGQGQEEGPDHGEPEQGSPEARIVPEKPLDHAESAIVGHGVRHQGLEVVGDRVVLQVSREQQGHLLPTKDENQTD